jgi:pyruvate/2-oxoglutarate dehydrogenase complex dihydrolipoamide acyltransferase (E2) component
MGKVRSEDFAAGLHHQGRCRSLKAFPNFNSSLDGDNLVLKQYYHIGFAADTPNGLVVPVIKNVDRRASSRSPRN